jgi:hypothetical protein
MRCFSKKPSARGGTFRRRPFEGFLLGNRTHGECGPCLEEGGLPASALLLPWEAPQTVHGPRYTVHGWTSYRIDCFSLHRAPCTLSRSCACPVIDIRATGVSFKMRKRRETGKDAARRWLRRRAARLHQSSPCFTLHGYSREPLRPPSHLLWGLTYYL